MPGSQLQVIEEPRVHPYATVKCPHCAGTGRVAGLLDGFYTYTTYQDGHDWHGPYKTLADALKYFDPWDSYEVVASDGVVVVSVPQKALTDNRSIHVHKRYLNRVTKLYTEAKREHKRKNRRPTA